ncbi:MAG: prepilin-type N-terminal cleavage/methylation domain-containing protein [Pirellulaceae bacterium]|nr:MAG: prepilin-type N-terminal cleavage/methylation domain-containing protein [Pirellulaceae bacterium]
MTYRQRCHSFGWWTPKKAAGFTLVELLVVLAIISILVALLLPAVQAARDAARRVRCQHNLMSLIIAVHNYELAYRCFPAGTVDEKGPIRSVPQGYHHNWLVRLLPYIEQYNAYDRIDFSVGVYHANNAQVYAYDFVLIHCPSSVSNAHNYAGIHHDQPAPIDETNNGAFILNKFLTTRDFQDGLSHTAFFGEINDAQLDEMIGLRWMSGTRATLRCMPGLAISHPLVIPAGQVVSFDDPKAKEELAAGAALKPGGLQMVHKGLVNIARGDGSVNGLSTNVDAAVWQQLANRADGELPRDKDF